MEVAAVEEEGGTEAEAMLEVKVAVATMATMETVEMMVRVAKMAVATVTAEVATAEMVRATGTVGRRRCNSGS